MSEKKRETKEGRDGDRERWSEVEGGRLREGIKERDEDREEDRERE